MTKREALNLCKLAKVNGVDADICPMNCGAYVDYYIKVWDVISFDFEADAVLISKAAIRFEEFLVENEYRFQGVYVPCEYEFYEEEAFRRFCGWPE